VCTRMWAHVAILRWLTWYDVEERERMGEAGRLVLEMPDIGLRVRAVVGMAMRLG
jgi:hypothetical protein